MKRSTNKALPDKTLVKKKNATNIIFKFGCLKVFIHICVKLTIYIYKLNILIP